MSTTTSPASQRAFASPSASSASSPSPTDRDWVQQALDEALGGAWPAGSPLAGDRERLRDALVDATVGGKRFRPRLVAAVHEALDGDAGAALPRVAAAVELLHTAFVVHDDVIDGDQTRRGTPTVPGRFHEKGLAAGADASGAATYALAGAVLTGDLALSAAFRAVATAPVDGETAGRLLDLVDRALVVSAAGEIADVRLSLGLDAASLGEALTMEEHKTAVYSFELPMQLGAVLAGASAELVTGIGEVGRLLGVAFQLRDDLMGVFGDPQSTGKSNLADLREGKCTPLIVHARTTNAWARIEPHWGDDAIDDRGAAAVRRALDASGSRGFVEQLADRYVETAVSRAAALGLPPELVPTVEELCAPLPEVRA